MEVPRTYFVVPKHLKSGEVRDYYFEAFANYSFIHEVLAFLENLPRPNSDKEHLRNQLRLVPAATTT